MKTYDLYFEKSNIAKILGDSNSLETLFETSQAFRKSIADFLYFESRLMSEDCTIMCAMRETPLDFAKEIKALANVLHEYSSMSNGVGALNTDELVLIGDKFKREAALIAAKLDSVIFERKIEVHRVERFASLWDENIISISIVFDSPRFRGDAINHISVV